MASFSTPLASAALVALSTIGMAQTFEDVTLLSGLASVPLDFHSEGTGIGAGDFEGDGDIDLIVPGHAGQLIRLYRNNGDMWFVDRTFGAGLGVARGARTVQSADIDNDGDLDVYIGNDHQPSQLFINDGTAKFSEQAVTRGLSHVTSNCAATFGDFDADGFVDLYVGNAYMAGSTTTTEANILYRNQGDGTFVDVTQQAGVGHIGATVATVFVDFDGDGRVDLLCVNDDGHGPAGQRNELFHNNGDGTFTARGTVDRADSGVDGRGVDVADAFNDGGMDYFVADGRPSNLFQISGSSGYINGTNLFGVAGGGSAGAVHFADFDNDGWQDLHVVNSGSANQIFRNPAQPLIAQAPWSEVVSPIAPTGGQVTAVVADFDNDGRVDILHRMLAVPGNTRGIVLHKNTTPLRNFVGVRTHGTISAKDGIGARVEVRTSSLTQTQVVRSGVGYLSGNDLGLHFGVGDATTVDIDVTWPTGQLQTFEGVPTNQVFEAHEPRFAMRGEARLGGVCFLDIESGGDDGLSYAIFLGTSASPGTLLYDGRILPVTFDWLTDTAIMPGNGLIWGQVAGLQNGGKGQAFMRIPDLPWIVGQSIYAGALIFDPLGDPLIHTVFPNSIEIEFVQ